MNDHHSNTSTPSLRLPSAMVQSLKQYCFSRQVNPIAWSLVWILRTWASLAIKCLGCHSERMLCQFCSDHLFFWCWILYVNLTGIRDTQIACWTFLHIFLGISGRSKSFIEWTKENKWFILSIVGGQEPIYWELSQKITEDFSLSWTIHFSRLQT